MQIDPTVLNKLLSRSDEQLWQTIVKIGALNGVSLSQTPPPPDEMARLRSILGNAKNTDHEQALNMLKQYRNKG